MYNSDGFTDYARECFRDETIDWDCLELPESEYIEDIFGEVKNDTKLPVEMFLIVELCIIDCFCNDECCIYEDYLNDINSLNNELSSITHLSAAKDIMQRMCKTLTDGYANFELYVEDSDVHSEYQDMLDYQRDPYAYYGLSRSDFM